ncbi:MAG: hypothetical protein JO107_01750, partial [Hyphomicrobiales bacterium]|nr:hypothetical protein [Hyphomicrobiales bacterium]
MSAPSLRLLAFMSCLALAGCGGGAPERVETGPVDSHFAQRVAEVRLDPAAAV